MNVDHFSLFLYQALQCLMKFEIDIEGIALEVETLRDLQRLEVRTEAAVWTSSNKDILLR